MENEQAKNNYKICCVTGHRPKGFPWNYRKKRNKQQKAYLEKLRDSITNLIEKHGFNYFISGCAIGADLDFAEICIELRDTKYPHIFVEGAIPCDNQDLKWSTADKLRYARTIAQLDLVHYVSHEFSMSCFQKRNEYMVDKSDYVVAVWNGEEQGGTWNTIKYARKKNKLINYIILGLFSKSFKKSEEAFRILLNTYMVKRYDPEQDEDLQRMLKDFEEWKKENNL